MQIVKTLLLIYLRRYPNRLRLSQFNFLSQYSWLQNVLTEVKGELFPHVKQQDETPSESAETAPPDAEVLQILSADIRGRRGTYHVDRWLHRRGQGYLFMGTQTGVERPVIIKEYLLNQQFYNQQELRDRQETFEKLAGIALADGRIQELRVLCPLEAIADTHASHRCYLVTAAEDAAPTLRQFLRSSSSPTAETVRHILLQVLQTLELLHQQKFRLPSGKTYTGLCHSNLSLDSVLWVDPSGSLGNFSNGSSNGANNSATNSKRSRQSNRAYIYLTDLALWENLFAPPAALKSASTASAVPTPQDDLKALGHIGFDLLMGQSDTTADPLDEAVWSPVPPLLKDVVERLLEISPPFASAAEARQALLQFPESNWVPMGPTDVSAEVEKKRSHRWWWLLLILGGAGLLIGILWAIWGRSPLTARSQSPRTCCLADVEAVPSGQFLYTYIQSGSWEYVWKQSDIGKRGWTLKNHLQRAYPNLDVVGQPVVSVEEAIAQVQTQAVDFAIIPQLGPLPVDLDSDAIAYDGLAVFVAFNYTRRNQGLPSALEGKLTLEELRKLYWGNATNWSALSPSRLRVQLYAPTNQEARQIFEQLVLEGQSLDVLDPSVIKTANTFEMLRSIIRDFEQPNTANAIGGIGFSHLSRVFGQCSVYPLAIDQADDGQAAIQPLVLQDGTPIQPQTDLCDRKGTYSPDTRLFQTEVYPLAYPLIVIYPRDNSLPPIGPKFVEALTTIEGQWLLEEGSLVPLDPIDDSVGQSRSDN